MQCRCGKRGYASHYAAVQEQDKPENWRYYRCPKSSWRYMWHAARKTEAVTEWKPGDEPPGGQSF